MFAAETGAEALRLPSVAETTVDPLAKGATTPEDTSAILALPITTLALAVMSSQ
jgi:hypothetical protein